jgi:hypothetical protein
MPFDPCREWLGIDAADLVHPHRVLGIPDSQTDADTILRVAEERIAQLARIEPGPFGKAHAALTARVAEARDTLLATATWDSSSDDVAEAPEVFLPSPPMPTAPLPPSLPPSAPWPHGDASIAVPHAPMPQPEPFGRLATAVLANAEPLPEPLPETLPETLPFRAVALGSRGPTVHRAAPSKGAPGLAFFAFFLAAAGVVGYVVYTMPLDDIGGWQLAMDPRGWAPGMEESSALAHAAPAIPPSTGTPPGAIPPPARPSHGVGEEPSERGEPMQPIAAAPSEQEAPMQPPVTASPMPDPREVERQTAAERARIAAKANVALRDAYTALQRREFDTADRAIESASKDVGDDVELATRIERWRLVATYARAFDGYRAKAFNSANAGREYEVDGRHFAIIEINPTMFIYRLEGKNVRKPRDEVHPRVEMAVVEGWFAGDGRSSNFIFIGTRWLCSDPPNTVRARDAWQKAQDGGENVSALFALLDDPIIRQAQGQ